MNVMDKGLSNDMILLDVQNNVRRMAAGLN